MKRLLFLIVLLVSVTVVFAQYCPSPKVVDGERSQTLHLNRQETELWLRYGNNQNALHRLASQQGYVAVQAAEQLKMLERILARVEQAHEQNKQAIERQLYQDKCKSTFAINAKGQCTSQLMLSPDWKKKAEYFPEGVYSGGLKVTTSGVGECSYLAQNVIVPEKQGPKYVIEDSGPYFDCNNPPPLSFYSRTYTSVHKGRSVIFRVFSYNDWEIHCANLGANFWELVKKVQYPSYPVVQPAPVTGGAAGIGKIETIQRLPEGKLTGVLVRTDGKGYQTRYNYVVKNVALRRDQKVEFAQDASGLVTSIAPVDDSIGRVETVKMLPGGMVSGVITRVTGDGSQRLNFLVSDMKLRQGQKVKFRQSATGLVTSVELVS
ncbi:MAG: hypothetical protein QW165_01600 [Candidatus Woesearchaeota archaeon]